MIDERCKKCGHSKSVHITDRVIADPKTGDTRLVSPADACGAPGCDCTSFEATWVPPDVP